MKQQPAIIHDPAADDALVRPPMPPNLSLVAEPILADDLAMEKSPRRFAESDAASIAGLRRSDS